MRHTYLYDAHLSLGAKMGSFGEWEMPLWYSEGVSQEVKAVREDVGLFDVSHMGTFSIRGNVLGALQPLVTNDLSLVPIGKAQYTLLLNEKGGIVDDLIAYRVEEDLWNLVVNAGNRDGDWAWIRERVGKGVVMEDDSESIVLVALQGPHAAATLSELGFSSKGIPRFGLGKGEILGNLVSGARTGYTGEDGFELFIPLQSAFVVWEGLISAGARPCGLAARDVLRLEASFPLHGQDISPRTSPLETGLEWAVKWNKGSFVGKGALLKEREEGSTRERVGIQTRIPVRFGNEVYCGEECVGRVTSGLFSSTLGHPIGLALISRERPEGDLVVMKGGRPRKATRVKLPFYRRKG